MVKCVHTFYDGGCFYIICHPPPPVTLSNCKITDWIWLRTGQLHHKLNPNKMIIDKCLKNHFNVVHVPFDLQSWLLAYFCNN